MKQSSTIFGGLGMTQLKIKIEREECKPECNCGNCGYIYEEYLEA